MYLCVLCGSENKQPVFPYTALTDWFFITETESVYCAVRTESIYNSTFCPHSVFVCFVWISEQTAIISLYSVNWVAFITETQCGYCAVRTGYLNIIQVKVLLLAKYSDVPLLHLTYSFLPRFFSFCKRVPRTVWRFRAQWLLYLPPGLTFGAGIIFLILEHSVYKMWIIQEPNTLELWNKFHFEERKKRVITCLKYSVPIFVE